ncbi:MAG: leucyl aminopeptidase [Rhabdochlamydiaceae bacterium]
MKISYAANYEKRTSAECTLVFVWSFNKKSKEGVSQFAFLNKEDLNGIHLGDFEGKEGEELVIYPQKEKEKRLFLIGLGEKKGFKKDSLRRILSGCVKKLQKFSVQSVNISFPEPGFFDVILETICLTTYRFDSLKGETLSEVKNIDSICLIGATEEIDPSLQKVIKVCEAVNLSRDLVNGNADDITPQALSDVAKKIAKSHKKLKLTVFDKKRIQKENMGLLLAVNRGSSDEPKLIILEYKGDPKSKKLTALVGKGITYDTGGLNIKVAGSSMETMKSDMSGAAAVLGTMKAISSLDLKVNVVAIIPATDNSIGPHAYKPGDVYKSLSGKTIEISNTDAEGRLILADALTYVQNKYQPDLIVDLATLTGNIVLALGDHLTGLFSNDDQLAKLLVESGDHVGEHLWRMPLVKDYEECLKSSYADLQNSGGRKAGAITAALFLQAFIQKNTPWAHLDIAGTAFRDSKYYHPTKATGVGVRLLVDFLDRQSV